MVRAPVGFLTQRSHPLLPHLLETFYARAPEVEPVLLLDERDFRDKDRKIFEQRTRGAFERPGLRLDDHLRLSVPDHNGPECRATIAERNLRLLINAGTPRLLSRDLLQSQRFGVLNVHPGILPKYRGASCPEWAVHHDDPVGVTAHFMDERLDGGPILFTRLLKVTKDMTYVDLRVALYRLAMDAMVDAVRLVLREEITASALPPQPSDLPVFKPIPDDLLALVEAKLASGGYAHAE